MLSQRDLPYVDPTAPQNQLRRAALRLMSTPAMVALEGGLPFQLTAWRLVPILMRLTGGHFARLLPVPVGVIETRDTRNGAPHRRMAVYFHDGERVTVIPSKAGLPDDPFWYQNALADPSVIFESKPYRAEAIKEEIEVKRLWALADSFYPPGVTYRERAAKSDRSIPILQLVPR
jgi:hypothetical protein